MYGAGQRSAVGKYPPDGPLWNSRIVDGYYRCGVDFLFFHFSARLGYFLHLTFKRRIKSRLPFAGIIRSSPYSPRFQYKG